MKAITLAVEARDLLGKKVKGLRKKGMLPASLYGKDVKSLSLFVPLKDFQKVYAQVGETGLVEIKCGPQSFHTLVADVQTHPLSRQPLHVQFHAVKLTEKIKANVPLKLIGEPIVVQSGEGVLLQTLNEIEVEALPADLPEEITVDASGLQAVNDQVVVAQLKIPAKVEVLTSAEEIVVKVAPAISEEAKKEAEEAAAKEAAKEAEVEPTAAEPVPAESKTPSTETSAKEG